MTDARVVSSCGATMAIRIKKRSVAPTRTHADLLIKFVRLTCKLVGIWCCLGNDRPRIVAQKRVVSANHRFAWKRGITGEQAFKSTRQFVCDESFWQILKLNKVITLKLHANARRQHCTNNTKDGIWRRLRILAAMNLD